MKSVEDRNRSDAIAAAKAEEEVKGEGQGTSSSEGGEGLGLQINDIVSHERDPTPPIPPRHADRPPPSPSKSDATARHTSGVPSGSSTNDSISSGANTPVERSITPTPLPAQSSISRSNSIAQSSLIEKIRPGSRLRIRRHTPSRLSDGASSDTSDISQSSNVRNKRLHEKSSTSCSSAMSEDGILITPSTSAFVAAPADGESDDGVEDLGVGRKISGGSMDKGYEVMDRRLSNISSNTVTFGPI